MFDDSPADSGSIGQEAADIWTAQADLQPIIHKSDRLLGTEPSRAIESSPPSAKPTVLDAVVVTGEVPGPGLWKVSKGDHILWILGTVKPLPKKMKWRSGTVEGIIAQSKVVLAPPEGATKVEADVFQAMAMHNARKLPENQRLADVLPPDTYAQWAALKDEFVGRNTSIERRRPRFAAKELFENAVDRLGLTLSDDVWRTVRSLARKHKTPITTYKHNVIAEDTDQAIAILQSAPLDYDMPCLEATMEALGTDTRGIVARANAWATGDIDVLRDIPIDPLVICSSILKNLPGIAEYQEQLEERKVTDWVRLAQRALASNNISFGVQPMTTLLQPYGVLARLRDSGYVVEDPQ